MASYLREYCTKIISGEIVSCEKVYTVCTKLLYDLDHPGKWHFDEGIAHKHISFIEKFCKTPSGQIGTPLKLMLFQKAILEAVFGFVDDEGIRRYNEVLIIMARKCGKSSLLSAIMIDMLVNDGEGAPQVLSCATARDQACLTFNAAHRMIKQSPMLSKHIKKRATDLYFEKNMGYIKPLASNTNSLDGLDIHCAVIDELSAIKNRDLYDLIKQGMSGRRSPILWQITTNGYLRDTIFDQQYEYADDVLHGKAENDRFLPFIYELDDPKEWDDESCWLKSSPALGQIKSIEYLREMVQKAKDDVSFKPTVLVKDFNLKQTGSTSWLRWEDLENKEPFPAYPFRYGIGGLDAADTTDMTAAKVICMRPGDEKIYVKSMYWIPERTIEEFENAGKLQGRDNVPYRLWKDKGLLRTVDSYKVDKHVVLDWFKEIKEQDDIYIRWIGYDPWHIEDALLRDFKFEFGEKSMIPIRQGVATLSQPMKDLKADLQNNIIVYDNNPIDKWCLANVAVKTDVNANIQPIKADDARRRIDGAMALLDAYVVLQDNKDDYLNLI